MHSTPEKHYNRLYDSLFLLAIAVFVAFKFQDLFLPYFWDELGVYSRSSLYLAEHGLSLLPSSIPPELSRGHPLLFSFIYGLFFKIFGPAVWVGHSLSLAVSVAFLTSLYFYVSRYSSKMIAFCSVLLTLCQPVFIAQSTLVLPEMMLGLFVFLSLMFYYEQKFLWFAAFSSAAIMVKESAIVLPVAVLMYGLTVQLLIKKRSGFLTPKAIISTVSPLLVFGIFLQIQKVQNGWYFFPYHIDSVSFDWNRFLDFNKGFRDFLLYAQGRYWWVKVLIVSGVFLLIKRNWQLKDHYFLMFVLFIIGFVIFGSFNFYMDRYMLAVIPLLVVVIVLSVENIYNKSWFIMPSVVALGLLCARDMSPNGFHYDTDMSFRNYLKLQQETTDYLCSKVTKNDAVLANFPLNLSLFEKNTGFKLCEQLDFHAEHRSNTKFVAITANTGEVPFPKENYFVVKHIEIAGVAADIYERIP